MRSITLASLAALLLFAAAASRAAEAAPLAPVGTQPLITAQQVDDNDDTRVEVQLVVLAVAAFTVVVVGSGAYLLRKKLGRVKGPPDQSAAGSSHH